MIRGLLGPNNVKGQRLIGFGTAATVAWVGTEIAAVVAPDLLAFGAAVLSLLLFGVGIILFLRAFLVAVERSRTEEISVAGLYLLMGNVAPKSVSLWLWGQLAVQTVVAVVAASVRPFTALAFGILVPMFGLAVTGSWAADYGAFVGRTVLRTKRAVRRPADEEDSCA